MFKIWFLPPDDVVEHIDGAVKVGEITELLRAEYAVVTGKHLLSRLFFSSFISRCLLNFILLSRWAIKRRAADHHIPGQVQLWHPCRGELPEAYCIPDLRPCVSNSNFRREFILRRFYVTFYDSYISNYRNRLHDADLGYVLIVDRRTDRWNAVKATLLRLSVIFFYNY